jgi:hypothetical protein
MIIYSVTVKIDLDIHDLWVKWMKEEHLPRVMETGCFVDHKMYRLLEEDETDGITYSMQYFANSIKDYFDYKADHAERLQREGLDLFRGKFTAFRSLLKEV